MKKIAVVILNWNGKKLLEQYLPSVIKYSNPQLSEVIVADNASDDDSLIFLKDNYPEVKTICLSKNYGFAEGYNQAILQLEHPYVMLLNSDVEVSPNWLDPMLKLMESDPDIAAIQPKIKAYKQKEMFEYAGACGGFVDYLGYPFCRGRILDKVEKDEGQYDCITEIFWASGAALLVRKEKYIEVGGLDADFFAHMEEIDLCWRLKSRGNRILCHPHSTVYHLGGGTLPNNSSRKLFLNFRNNLLMLYKNLPPQKLYTTIIKRMILDGVAAIKFLITMEPSNFWAVVRAHYSFYRMLKKYRKKREVEISQMSYTNHPQMLSHSIIICYFIRKQRNFSVLKF